MADNNGALDWGDVISNDDAGEFQVAPEGDCTFTVRAVQRGRREVHAEADEHERDQERRSAARPHAPASRRRTAKAASRSMPSERTSSA